MGTKTIALPEETHARLVQLAGLLQADGKRVTLGEAVDRAISHLLLSLAQNRRSDGTPE